MQLLSLDAARPHVAAPACCAHCGHAWAAVVPDLPQARENLECPACGKSSNAGQHARVVGALRVLDDLREKVSSGQIVGFAAVGIEAYDTTLMWISAVQDVSRLRVMGAISHLGHMYAHGEDLT